MDMQYDTFDAGNQPRTPELYVTHGSLADFEGMLAHLCENLEAEVESAGWNLPASLWKVVGVDLDEQTHAQVCERAGQEGVNEIGAVAALRVDCIETIECHPNDALFRRRLQDIDPEALGTILIHEAWTAPAGEEHEHLSHPQPSERSDRTEIRMLNLVMRDGTEVTIQRERGGEPQTAIGGRDGFSLGGTVPESLRLFTGAPSRAAEHTPLPSPAVLWRRHILHGYRTSGYDPDDRDALHTCIAEDLTVDVPTYEAIRDHLIAGLRLLCELLKDGGPAAAIESLTEDLTTLEWWDADMCATHLHRDICDQDQLSGWLNLQVLLGGLDPRKAAEIAEATELPEPAGGWGATPGRNNPCPCGSGRRWWKCHRDRS